MLTNHHLAEGVAMPRSTLAATLLMSLTIAANADGFEHSSRGAAPAVWSWTGCYVGGNVGGVWDRSENWTVGTPGGAFFGESLGGHDVDGWIGGVQAGCDYQFAGGFVIGAQGDYGWTNADGTHPSALETGVFYHSDVDALASITGRIGYAWDRLLGYVKVGGAWERVDYSASTILVFAVLMMPNSSSRNIELSLRSTARCSFGYSSPVLFNGRYTIRSRCRIASDT